jgi:hypothetical protein
MKIRSFKTTEQEHEEFPTRVIYLWLSAPCLGGGRRWCCGLNPGYTLSMHFTTELHLNSQEYIQKTYKAFYLYIAII